MIHRTLLMFISMTLVLGSFSSPAFIAYAASIENTTTKCIKYDNSETGRFVPCCTETTVENKQRDDKQSNMCLTSKHCITDEKCPSWDDVLQDKNTTESDKETNIGINAGVLEDSGTTNSSNNITTVP
jgi:hypothetical protein